MSGKDFAIDVRAAPGPPVTWQGLLGYLNFAEGRPDPRFQGQFHAAYLLVEESARGKDVVRRLADLLDEQLTIAQQSGAAAFKTVGQARTIIQAALRELPAAYVRHHADLLAHQTEANLFRPFFLARACEAVLACRAISPDETPEQLAHDALARLNDFVGYRPIPILENRRSGEVYDHERCAPIPLYLRGVGVAAGKYQKLLLEALEILAHTEPELLEDAQFDLKLLDEISLDPRAYDHNHPANRRPNHVFGEWDPHHLDNQGRHRRFVVRQNTLDGLLTHVETANAVDRGERMFDAAAGMAGTMLMASALCGRSPNSHDSMTTLSSIVPQIARLRDRFYDHLLSRMTGQRGERIRSEIKQYRQPFGAARQNLNRVLAQERALQLQEWHLALLYAALGYSAASRERAASIATVSARMAAEMRSQITSASVQAERGQPAAAEPMLAEAGNLLHRGIACGAFADPWSILGFQGLYPLFPAREDAIHDMRVDELLGLVGDLFAVFAQTIGEAAARGQSELRERLSAKLTSLASWWDQFATFEVGDLPRVHGGEAAAAAEHIADALTRWHERTMPSGPAADVAFWREHLEGFRTPGAFARVVTALLDRADQGAAMGLLIAWLGEAPGIPLEDGDHSFHKLIRRWAADACSGSATADRLKLMQRFFESLEANAEDYWHVPTLTFAGETPSEDDHNVFGAAYEGMTYQDSADDGTEGAVLGDISVGAQFPLEEEIERLSSRLQFLATVADLWWQAARCVPPGSPVIEGWLGTSTENLHRLGELLDQLHQLSVPEPLAGFEGAVEYDRRRAMKEEITEEAITAAVATERAMRALQAHSPQRQAESEGWAAQAIAVEQSLARNDTSAMRLSLRQLIPLLQHEPLLYVPLSAGGHPRQILRARATQAFLNDLMQQLPKMGLLRETFLVVKTARAMEQSSPPEGRRVTEFDRLFPVALQASVHAILDLADQPDHGMTDEELHDALKHVVDPFLMLWIDHSQSLRLSVLESIQSPVEWERLRQFVERYGRELFTAGFLNLANLRSILHRGVSAWLDELPQQDNAPEQFLSELGHALPRGQAIRILEFILQAVVENYEEYRDYNTTTTQSDYGENLFVLLDYLRLKSAYERDNWRMRPLVLVHEVLCRRGRTNDAEGWQEGIVKYTREHADQRLVELAETEARHGIKLRTVQDRLQERFVAPLAIDRLCALVEPAWNASRSGEGEGNSTFERLRQGIAEFAATPTGVGLDVPPWLRRLEGELYLLKHEPVRRRFAKSQLTIEQLREQLESDWEHLGSEL